VLVAIAWSASWSGETPLAHHSFFPLWLGYILTVDALTSLRSGSSLWERGRLRFASLFLASVPLWWLFEAINARVGNWSYQVPHVMSWFAYRAESSLAFSTVVPAIFVTAELYRTFAWPFRAGRWIALRPGNRGWPLFSAAGLTMIGLTLLWPDLFFPLVWIGLFFLIDPVNRLLGGRSIAQQVERGWWGTVWLLFAAGLTCGFFWEMWNSRAMPKWTYDIAYAERLHLFEMPILGYGGYFPFALETYALVMLVNRWLGIWPTTYIRFDQTPSDRDASEHV
jgi:hypothetical protein